MYPEIKMQLNAYIQHDLISKNFSLFRCAFALLLNEHEKYYANIRADISTFLCSYTADKALSPVNNGIDGGFHAILKIMGSHFHYPKNIISLLNYNKLLKACGINLSVADCRLGLWATQTLLCFKADTPEYKLSLEFLRTSIERDNTCNIVLTQLLRKEYKIKNVALSDADIQALHAIPQFYNLPPDEAQADVYIDILHKILLDFVKKEAIVQKQWINLITTQIKTLLQQYNRPSFIGNKLSHVLLEITKITEQNLAHALDAWSNYMQSDESDESVELFDGQFELRYLKSALSNESQTLRIQARDILLALGIKLNVNQMLSLSVDGLQTTNMDSDDMFLLMGETGSGKSTLINCLAGVEYNYKESADKVSFYLEPKSGHVEPCKTAFGTQSCSLYCQDVQVQGMHFCDTPGFGDTRSTNEKTIAFLGIPLAIQKRKIRAIIIALPHEHININKSGRKPLGDIYSALSSIFNLTEENTKSFDELLLRIPIVFCITKIRQSIDPFEREEMKNGVLDSLCALRTELESHFISESTSLKSAYEESKNEVDDLLRCIDELGNILKEDGIPGANQPRGTAIARWFIDDRIITQGAWVTAIENYEQELLQIEPGLSEEIIKRLKNILMSITQFKTTERISRIQVKIRELQEELTKKMVLQVDKKNAIEKLIAENRALKLIPRSHEESAKNQFKKRLFLLRGYKGRLDNEDDDKEALMHHLSELKQLNQFVPQSAFKFDLLSDEFKALLSWGILLVKKLAPIDDLTNLPDSIQMKRQFLDEVDSDITKEMDKLNETLRNPERIKSKTTQIESTEDNITCIQTEIDKLTQKLSSKEQSITRCTQELNEISSDEIVDYCSSITPYSKVDRMTLEAFIRWTKKTFSAWHYSVELGCAIQKIEFSCCINNETKQLVFKNPLSREMVHCGEGFDDTHFSAQANIELDTLADKCYQVIAQNSYFSTGLLVIKNCDFDKGIFTAEFTPKTHFELGMGIRFFVRKKDIPDNIATATSLQKEIDKLKEQLANNQERLRRLKSELSIEKNYLQFLLNGSVGDQRARIDRIVNALNLLELDMMSLLYTRYNAKIPHLKVHLEFIQQLAEDKLPALITYCLQENVIYNEAPPITHQFLRDILGDSGNSDILNRDAVKPKPGFLAAICTLCQDLSVNLPVLFTILRPLSSQDDGLKKRRNNFTKRLNEDIEKLKQCMITYHQAESTIHTFKTVFLYFREQISTCFTNNNMRKLEMFLNLLDSIHLDKIKQIVLEQPEHFRENELLPPPQLSEEELEKRHIVALYEQNPIPGLDIATLVPVRCKPELLSKFNAQRKILENRSGNSTFDPAGWNLFIESKEKTQRKYISDYFEEAAKPFYNADYSHVKSLMVFHGASDPKAIDSILCTGFEALASTDDGYFGVGIYGTLEPSYAWKVAGQDMNCILVNKVIYFNGYPVIDKDDLRGKPKVPKHDVHLVWVSPQDPKNPDESQYFATPLGGMHAYTEIVVFESAQFLPAYQVILQDASPQSLALLPEPEHAYQAGLNALKDKHFLHAYYFLTRARFKHEKAAEKAAELSRYIPGFKGLYKF